MRSFCSACAVPGLFLLLAAAALAAPARGQEPGIRWEPYVGETRDGSRIEGRLGRIRVPESRAADDGRTIEIAFVHYATDNPDPGPPIVFLIGGPGGQGVEWCAEVANDERMRLLDHADVIGIDQRGTGFSRPDLSDGPSFAYELPLDRAITREDVVAAWQDAVARCHDHWTAQGVNLGAYNTEESADDVDAVRAALGLEKIVPWGTSYGSHLALAYLRRHPEHVARAVLMKVEGPDHTWKLPSTTQARLEHLSALVAADPALAEHFPDFMGTVRSLLGDLEEEPVTITSSRGDQDIRVTVGPYDLQTVIAGALGGTRNLAGLPAAVHLMTQGYWEHMLGFILRNRQGEVGSAMGIMMDCASGATRERRGRIERELADPANLLGDAIAAPFYPETCIACDEPDLGDAFRAPMTCDVPVLFVSGDLDARTPPGNVEEIRGGFSNHAHVLVVNAGHDDRELTSEAYRSLVHAFLRGDEVEDTTITLSPIEFMPIRQL